MTKDTKTTVTAHTPGPWIVSDEGLYILEIRNDAIPIARVDYKSGKTRGANARLIAAAPELLAACKNAIDYIQTEVDIKVKDHGVGGKPAMPNTACWLHDILLSAIAKAQA